MDKRPKTVKLRLAAAAAVDVRSMTVTLDVIYYYAGAFLRIERDFEDKAFVVFCIFGSCQSLE